MIRNRRLFWLIYPSFLAVTLLSLLALGWYATRAMERFLIQEARADLRGRAELLIASVIPHIQPLDPTAMDRAVKRIAGQTDTRVTIVAPNGVVVGDSAENPERMDNHGDRPEIRDAFLKGFGDSIRYSSTLGQRMMYAAVPIRIEENAAGVLRTAIPIAFIDNALRSVHNQLAAGGVLVAVLASAVCLMIARRISRPIEEMQRSAETFASGELSHRIRAPAVRELASLAETLNRMARQLENRIRTIENQRSELASVLAGMAEGVIAVDREERILNMNRAAADILGHAPSAMQGRSIQEAIRNRELHGMIRDALSGKDPLEADIVLFGERERILHTRCSPLLQADGQRLGALAVLNDVTQLRLLENMRRDFAANVSHEIKTPLTAIQGFVETLAEDASRDPEQVSRFLAVIQRHVSRLSAVINDLLHLSRIEQESEQARTVQMQMPLIDLVQSSVQLCRDRLKEKNISLEIECDDALTARMDPTMMEQAVVNLIDNAVKYSSSDCRIRIHARESGKEVVIGITDEGIGIAAKHLPRLFERFYRVDRARSRKQGGTGLGLAIVKHIAQAHRGRVSVDSEPGRGSTFRIHLPAGGDDD